MRWYWVQFKGCLFGHLSDSQHKIWIDLLQQIDVAVAVFFFYLYCLRECMMWSQQTTDVIMFGDKKTVWADCIARNHLLSGCQWCCDMFCLPTGRKSVLLLWFFCVNSIGVEIYWNLSAVAFAIKSACNTFLFVCDRCEKGMSESPLSVFVNTWKFLRKRTRSSGIELTKTPKTPIIHFIFLEFGLESHFINKTDRIGIAIYEEQLGLSLSVWDTILYVLSYHLKFKRSEVSRNVSNITWSPYFSLSSL